MADTDSVAEHRPRGQGPADASALPSAIGSAGLEEIPGHEEPTAEQQQQQQQPTLKYSIEDMLALRTSKHVQAPGSLSLNTPFRPGAQTKLAEAPQDGGKARGAPKAAPIGLEHIVRAQRDAGLGPQRQGGPGGRHQGSPQRGLGGGRAAGNGAGPVDHAGPEGHRPGSHGAKNGGHSRGGQARSSGGSMGTGSWRSTGAARFAHGAHAHAAPSEDNTQPEWMDSDMAYDEDQSARRMQDMEEWKRRMREGAAHGANPATAIDQGLQPGESDDKAAVRESRFLRLFSGGEPQQDPMAMVGAHYSAVPGMQGDAMAYMGAIGGEPQQPGGDQLSKLFKVFGNKVNVGGAGSEYRLPNGYGPPGLVVGAGNIAHQVPTMPAGVPATALAGPPATALAGPPAAAIATVPPATATGGPRAKTASPAPINEALRGIVPTSVFRKSVQSSGSTGAAGVAGRRPESRTSSRSATPARNLPSWLVELSRSGAPAPAAPAADGAPREALGQHDLVDALEREFPVMNISQTHGDGQSVSSLSVQASGGAPSEPGSMGQNAERTNGQVQSAERAAGQALSAGPPRLSAAQLSAQNPQQLAMAAGLPPQGMMGMAPPPPPPHMLVPGMAGAGPMGPMGPMGMVPPGPPMGFPPNMVFGMVPPPGMYGGDQMMMMGPPDMPPGMMYGQMSAPHTMFTAAMAYPGQPVSLPQSTAPPATQPFSPPHPPHPQQ